ncbi:MULTISPECIES: hypothetical protein [Xanthomonas]|uniref:hypothetical protein n=1 Tax=Xanthomonas TaxID=338 RepID=UPI001ADA807D|nr:MULTISPECIES: hypothetical protein [unclassified Xanthomonas]MBO9873460.1 hypothetical protein [Xanthomonas sp. D-93]WNH45245.1 hypothetical protein PG878_01860 [Xanthomonas sp. A6251]
MRKGWNVFGKVGLGRMTKDEYQANLNGLNMFFGAVLGLVLTGTERLDTWQFGVVLGVLASLVISILFISSSRHRVAYAIYTLAVALLLPKMIDAMLKGHDLLPDKVQPTLIVWTMMTILVEFWGRERDQGEATAASDPSR